MVRALAANLPVGLGSSRTAKRSVMPMTGAVAIEENPGHRHEQDRPRQRPAKPPLHHATVSTTPPRQRKHDERPLARGGVRRLVGELVGREGG